MRLQRLLVASDGEITADAALRVAKLLADRDGAEVEVVGVLSPPIPVPPLQSGLATRRTESRNRRAVVVLRRKIRHQLRERIGVSWPLHLCVGYPPERIVERADAMHASLVMLGHTPPTGMTEHRTSRHTAEQIAIGGNIPVLSVPSGSSGLPRVVFAINDNSAAADRAARTAAAILAEGGILRESREAVSRGTLHDAEAIGAELVVLPLPGHTPTTRSLMGGCVMDVLDHARCAVLIAPTSA